MIMEKLHAAACRFGLAGSEVSSFQLFLNVLRQNSIVAQCSPIAELEFVNMLSW